MKHGLPKALLSVGTILIGLSLDTLCGGLQDERKQAVQEDSTSLSDSGSALDIERRLKKIHDDETSKYEEQLRGLTPIIDTAANAVDQYSRRGDLHLFLGEFQKAEDDYRAMVRLNPELDASHWRLGIAMYFAGHPEDAAAQFDRYHSFDNVDRENGIWRYLSHRKAFDREKARQQLLKYEKDDRPPFREVYRLFDGTMTPDQVLAAIPEKASQSDRDSRLFYSNLYIGLNHSAEGRLAEAKTALREATLNAWPQRAGYGPNYMWHVGRLQLNLLEKQKN